MFQPDLFAGNHPAAPVAQGRADRPLDIAAILNRLTTACERPRYNFMILNLIAEASTPTGSAGHYVRAGNQRVPIRDWLCDAMMPVAQRDPRRRSIADKVRLELEAARALLEDLAAAEQVIAEEVQRRVRLSGRTSVSRAVSELVRAGLLRRHYQGYRVDRHNRGAQRQAVYTITEDTRRALVRGR